MKELVISAIAYGDETYFPGMPWNVGNCTLGIGVSLWGYQAKSKYLI